MKQFFALLLVPVFGCGSMTNREIFQGALYAVAHGVKSADEACAHVAEMKKDLALATKCSKMYRIARASVLSAESVIQATHRVDSDVFCALSSGLQALTQFVAIIRELGVIVPSYALEALSLSASIEAMCKVQK